MSVQKVFYKAPHNYDYEAESDLCGEFNDEPSKTVQSMAEEADINVLMHRYGITGKMPDNVHTPQYGDFEEIFDFQTALQAVRNAQENFDSMPADIRYKFANDPQRFLEFCEDPANGPELVKMGLATKREVIPDGKSFPPGSLGEPPAQAGGGVDGGGASLAPPPVR